MARHAGFAVAVSVGEAFINQSISAAVINSSPLGASQLFTIPSSVPLIGGGTARLSGIGLFEQRPQVKLLANAANSVRMTASAIVFVTGTTDLGLPFTQISETWKVRLTGTAAVGIDVDVAPDGLFVRWVPGQSSIDALSIAVLSGPPPPRWLLDALNSAPVRTALSLAIQQLQPIRVTPKLMDRTLTHVQKGDFPSTGVSLFEWFVISETVSRAAVRILDGAVAIGIDLRGRSVGDLNQLVDLRVRPGDAVGYRWLIRDNTMPQDRPLLVARPIPADRDIAVLFNGDVLGAIVADVSRQIANTPIAPSVRIVSVSIRPETFTKPLRGREKALRVDVTLRHSTAGDVRATLHLQLYVQEDARGLATSFPPFWLLYVGHLEVDVPWWVNVAVVVLGVALSAIFPALASLVAVGVIAAIDGIIPGAIDSGTGQAIAAQGRGYALVQAVKSSTLPTPQHQDTWESVHMAVSSDGLDLRMSIVAASLRFGSLDDTVDVARLVCSFNANNPSFWAKVELRDDLRSLAAGCTVQLLVTKSSTGADVAATEGPFATNSFVEFSHLTADLYHEDLLTVHARIWLNSTSLTGLLFSADVDVPVTDILDRHRPFVTWDEHMVYFRNAGTGWRWWQRRSRPKMHRTATTARCAAVRRAATQPNPAGLATVLRYHDGLDFDWSEIPANRDQLCDHCFFDTPTSTVVSPRDDWFTNRLMWPREVSNIVPTDAAAPAAVGPSNGRVWVVQPGQSATFGSPRRGTSLDLAELLRPSAITSGDTPNWRTLARSRAVAFARNGNAPAASGGWESCAFTFGDGDSTLTIQWDERIGAPRDPRILANGSIRGADYIRAFQIIPNPNTQIGDQEVISFLLFDLSDLNINALDSYSVTITGFTPGPAVEATPELDAIAFFL